MVSQINPKPNTFYKAKNLDDDIGAMPVYGDAYVGLTTTYDLISSPDSTYYLGEATVITENDFVYGEGTLTECYLNLYTNTFTQVNQQTAPWVDIYGLKSNIDLIEGDLSIDTTVGNISTYSSIYNMETPWVVEDFDGTNKFFIDAPSRWQPGYTAEDARSLFIKKNDYMTAVYSTHEGATDHHSGISIDNAWEEIVHAVDYGESKAAQGAQGFVNWLGREVVSHPLGGTGLSAIAGGTAVGFAAGGGVFSVPGAIAGGILGGLAGQVYADGEQMLTLTKHSDGLYYWTTPTNLKNKELSSITKHLVQNRISEGHSKGWWTHRGAWTQKQGGRSNAGEVQYDSFDETFVAHCDQYNSIFSEVFRRGMARDIKSETTGGSGDDPKFFAYLSTDLVSSDTASDGNALKMKLFWENYSGSVRGSIDPADENFLAWDDANYFGYASTSSGISTGSKHPLPQTIFASINDIPAPSMYDVTTPSLSSSTVPEIEVVFKIEQMPTLPFIASTSSDPFGSGFASTRGREISRSFSITFAQRPVSSGSNDPLITENFTDNGPFNFYNTDFPYLTINCCKIEEGNNIDVVGMLQDHRISYDTGTYGNCESYKSNDAKGYGGTAYKVIPGSAAATDEGWDDYHTQIPEGEWVTMRIKFGNKEVGEDTLPVNNNDEPTIPTNTSGDVIAYFPNLRDQDGKMQMIKVFSPVPTSPRFGFFPNCLTFWANNMRSINEIPDYSTYTTGDTLHINNGYTQIDNVTDDDKIVEVVIDKIGFYGWNSLTNNASVTMANGMGDMLRMPNVTGIPVAPINNQITVESDTEGSDNIYGGFTQPIASYLSFGYDSSGTAEASVQNHKLLFNDFFTAQPSLVQAIPDSNMKAGYFTSGNYAGSGSDAPSRWFENLTVGSSGTNNLRIGGVDNYIDGFSTKGLMGVSSSFAGWVKTGNPYVAAKVLTVSDDGTQITVDKPQIFNTDLDQEFVVEREGIGWTDGTRYAGPFGDGYRYEEYLAGSGSKGYVGSLTQNQAKRDNLIFLSDSLLYDDQGAKLAKKGGSYAAFSDWNSATRIRISPKKFWVNLAYVNVSQPTPSAATPGPAATFSVVSAGAGYIPDPGNGNHDFTMEGGTGTGLVINAEVTGIDEPGNPTSPRTINTIINPGSGYVVGDVLTFPSDDKTADATCTVESVTVGWGAWYQDISGSQAVALAPRSYNTVVPVSGGASRGTTFNETQYNDGIYSNRWDLDFTDPNSRYVINTVDYSFGAVEELEEGEAPLSLSTGGGRGYIARDFLLSGQNYISLNNYMRINKPNFGDDFNFMMVPSFMNTEESTYTVNFNTDDATTNVPQLIYGIKDMPPKISDFTASPSIDFLQDGADIYNSTKAGATDIRFEWKEEEDVWHRVLWVDTAPITTKYHTANFIAPLNETGATAYYYLSAGNLADGTKVALTGTNAPNIEGAMGYGSYATGATSISSSAGDLALGSADEFTFMATLKPNDPDGATMVFFQASGNSNNRTFIGDISSLNKVGVTFNDAAVSLESATTYDCDGVQPLAIVVTYDKTLANNNAKLYINGKLEDTADYTSDFSGSTNQTVWIASGKPTAAFFPYSGFVEEITFHSKAAYIPTTPSSFLLPTRQLADLSAGNSKFYNGRLFAFDYHNIRGMGRTDVGRSTQVGWKVTGI